MLVASMITSGTYHLEAKGKMTESKKIEKEVFREKEIKDNDAEKKAAQMVFTKENIKGNQKKDNYIVFSKANKFTAKKKVEKLQDTYKETEQSDYSQYAEEANVISLELTGEQAKKIQNQSDVVHIEKDIELKACEERIENREIIEKQYKNSKTTWNKKMIKANNADTFTTEKVKVAILDSGIDYGNDVEYVEQINLIPGEEELTPLFTDSTGHGAGVAGIIAAQDNGEGITGINPNVEIYSAKILDDDNSAPVSRVVEGIYWAMEKDVNIINLSFSTPQESQILEKAIKDAYNQGILIIAAAGNDKTVEYPAAYPEVMAVGSVDSEGIVSDNSGKGDELEIVAPGEKVTATSLLGGTTNASGTSLAAPHVVGVASLLWEKDLSVSHKFIRDLLNYSANGYGDEKAYGNGLVDYEYACEIYDEFKKDYDEKEGELQEDAVVEENTSERVVFEDNTAVEGKWTGHKKMAAQYTNVKKFQEGAKFPDIDIEDSNEDLFGLDNINHAWHGGRYSNYVADYVYICKVAEAVGTLGKEATSTQITNKIKSVTKQAGMDNCDKAKLKEKDKTYANGVYQVMKTGLVSYVAPKLKELTKNEKKAFLYGIASHIATDVYAHASYRYDSKWIYIKHVNPSGTSDPDYYIHADSPKCVPRRFASAKVVLENVVSRYKGNGTDNPARDFWIDNYNVPRHLRIYYNSQQLKAARGAEYDDATYRLYKMRYYSSNAGEKNANILEAYKVISITIE